MQGTVKVTYEDSFDAAHFLPNYEGKCKNLHGHTWKVKVGISGELIEEGPMAGMVVDFSVIKATIQILDHQNLSDILVNPTAELIARSLFREISSEVGCHNSTASVDFVEVWESPKACARVEY